MTRYLTPSRLCTLVLIDIYLSENTPPASSVQILDLLIQNTSTSGSHESDSLDQLSHPPADATAFAAELAPCPSVIPGRSVLDVFYQHLWKLDSLDALSELYERLNLFVVPPVPQPEHADTSNWKLTRASPLGQFVRRCSVEFTRLQFADSLSLWNAFVRYRAPSYEVWAQRNPDSAQRQATIDDHDQTRAFPLESSLEPTASLISSEDIESVLSSSITHLQKSGTRLPPELKANLQQWLLTQRSSNTQSLQHFMSFFDAWKAGQYSLALENLHRYFDYSLAGTKSGQDNTKVYYQYALLHLSVLHSDFERWEESISAMDECIATARENQDTACLNFALSWLLYLRQAHPRKSSNTAFGSLAALAGDGGTEQDELAFLKAKARESKHWSLMSSTLLEEAKLDMRASGTSAKAMEHILQSAHLNRQHSLLQLMPATTLFKAAAFDRLGQAHVCKQLQQSVEQAYERHCPLSDRVRTQCRLAYSMAQDGDYDRASSMLQTLHEFLQGTLKLEQRVAAYTGLISLLRHLRSQDLAAAAYVLSQLTPLRSFSDPEIISEINSLEIELLIRRQDLDTALSKTNALLSSSRSNNSETHDIAHIVPLLILKSRIFALAGRPTKAFSLALRAASTAERCLLIPLLLEALAFLAIILIDMSEFKAAKDIIEAVLPHAFEASCAQHLVARLFASLAESHAGFAGHGCVHGSVEQAREMRAAMSCAERGREAYATVGDQQGLLDCLVIKAECARWLGDGESEKQADGLYLQVLQERHGE